MGVSTHSSEEAQAAVEAGADYCGVGAMYSTALKPDRIPAGPDYLAAFIEQHPAMPHLAIGGITTENVGHLVSVGGRGVAVSTAICGADDPRAVVRAMKEAFDEVKTPVRPG